MTAIDEWLVAAARKAGDHAYDADQHLIRMPASPTSIHTRLGGTSVHGYRESTTYALVLLETGAAPEAVAVLEQVLAGQDLDPASPTYGVWPYYLEEPLAAMVRPDPNWADFVGQELVLIMLRHGCKLPDDLQQSVRSALAAAAQAIIRRNVSMSYTNIAAKGTLVTLGAGQVLNDPGLTDYGRERIERLAATVEESGGSFAEYNSPTYWLVTSTAMSMISQYIADPRSAAVATRLVDRLWQHLVARWHRPTGQLSGPMSRAYRNDLSDDTQLLAHLCKAAGELPPFDHALDRVAHDPASGLALIHTALLRSQASAEVVRRLTDPAPPGLRRELFSRGRPDRIGTTWLDASSTIGTVNFADSWFQRRNLLGYWGTADPAWQRPARSVRIRVLKDDYDFVSARFSSVQEGPHVLWHVGFASPGGDRHVYRDDIPAGEPIRLSSLVVLFEFRGTTQPDIRIDGEPARAGSTFGLHQQVTVSEAGCTVHILPAGGRLGDVTPMGRITADSNGVLTIGLELFSSTEPTTLDLSALGAAFLGGGLSLLSSDGDHELTAPVATDQTDHHIRWTWTPNSHLELTGRTTVGTVEQHADTHAATVDNHPPT